MTCPVCADLVQHRNVSLLADHLEQRHRINFGVRRKAQEMVFETLPVKD